MRIARGAKSFQIVNAQEPVQGRAATIIHHSPQLDPLQLVRDDGGNDCGKVPMFIPIQLHRYKNRSASKIVVVIRDTTQLLAFTAKTIDADVYAPKDTFDILHLIYSWIATLVALIATIFIYQDVEHLDWVVLATIWMPIAEIISAEEKDPDRKIVFLPKSFLNAVQTDRFSRFSRLTPLKWL